MKTTAEWLGPKRDPFAGSHMMYEPKAATAPSRSIIIGIDPGLKGAIAALDRHGCLLGVHDMPLISHPNLTIPDGDAVHDILLQLTEGNLRAADVWIERAQGMPKQKGQFNYGTGFGSLLGTLRTLCLPYELLSPHVWKREAKLSKDKSKSLHAARRHFPEPEHQAFFKLAKHEGRAEAALIARHGWAKRGAT